MQSQPNEPAVLPHPVEAANDDVLPLRNGAASSGWDAYEIWRVRIKAVYDARRSSSGADRARKK